MAGKPALPLEGVVLSRPEPERCQRLLEVAHSVGLATAAAM